MLGKKVQPTKTPLRSTTQRQIAPNVRCNASQEGRLNPPRPPELKQVVHSSRTPLENQLITITVCDFNRRCLHFLTLTCLSCTHKTVAFIRYYVLFSFLKRILNAMFLIDQYLINDMCSEYVFHLKDFDESIIIVIRDWIDSDQVMLYIMNN